ncbi:hypothetical protein [Celeribacter neptunius]|uniref:Uncharacterized protein n=1 Tax=Celeribacter neptunius TaxID=588602 RepID=A0A1I3VDP7_9RHOB|nr:hypothetical protein [Celeribacter neptunius]SFJ93312.1 hypothetical protein SAMN04487991_3320 [Celeribacter neptunius]
MTRNIVDTSHRAAGNGRLVHYLSHDRAAGRSRVWEQIDRARKGPKDASRVKQFLRVERGQLA